MIYQIPPNMTLVYASQAFIAITFIVMLVGFTIELIKEACKS